MEKIYILNNASLFYYDYCQGFSRTILYICICMVKANKNHSSHDEDTELIINLGYYYEHREQLVVLYKFVVLTERIGYVIPDHPWFKFLGHALEETTNL